MNELASKTRYIAERTGRVYPATIEGIAQFYNQQVERHEGIAAALKAVGKDFRAAVLYPKTAPGAAAAKRA